MLRRDSSSPLEWRLEVPCPSQTHPDPARLCGSEKHRMVIRIRTAIKNKLSNASSIQLACKAPGTLYQNLGHWKSSIKVRCHHHVPPSSSSSSSLPPLSLCAQALRQVLLYLFIFKVYVVPNFQSNRWLVLKSSNRKCIT